MAAVAAAAMVVLAGCGGGGARSVVTTVGGRPGQPTAIYAPPANGQAPRGLVMLIHGGSWLGLNPRALQVAQVTAGIFRAFDYETMTVDYRHGAQGVADVEQFYRDARRRFPHLPICAFGVSAGGHIALMLATEFPDLRCVIDQAGPTDLPALAHQRHGTIAPYPIAVNAFGTAALEQYSPALHASSIRAKLLLVYAQDDPLVPVAQGQEMARADPSARLITLPAGSAAFVHTGIGAPISDTGVDPVAKRNSQVAELKFLNSNT